MWLKHKVGLKHTADQAVDLMFNGAKDQSNKQNNSYLCNCKKQLKMAPIVGKPIRIINTILIINEIYRVITIYN